MTLAKLYGVSVGPGAPDLLTLRAKRVLEEVSVLALPRASTYAASTAWGIVRPVLTPAREQERLFLTFPMSKEPALVRPCIQNAADEIERRLQQQLSVAFVTEGDASLYSTFGYVRHELLRRFPDLEVEVVPGVSSVVAVPAVSGFSLADGQERIAIVPATYGVDDIVELLEKFDTVVFMKLGGELPKIRAALETTGLMERAVFVSKATMSEQRIVRDVRELSERGDCFAMLIVTRRARSGLLIGEAEHRALQDLPRGVENEI